MASSAKRKKEKKKDFQKPKLKVGKTKPKAANFTDTSFKAKSITLNQQSISVAAPTNNFLFAHHVSSLRNRSDGHRAESLAYLTTAITSTPAGMPLPEPTATLLPKLQPLILDGSSAVRQQLLKLFRSLPGDEINGQIDRMLLYVHAGMTHLSRDIRSFSMDVLDWLLDMAGEGLVGCAGGWTKTLDCFFGFLGWKDHAGSSNGWSSYQKQVNSKPGTETKVLAKQLMVLANLIRTGVGSSPKDQNGSKTPASFPGVPLRHVRAHFLPERSNAFANLNLFESSRREDVGMLEDREDRQRVFARDYSSLILDGVAAATQEGGELGRAGANLKRAVTDGLLDFTEEDI